MIVGSEDVRVLEPLRDAREDQRPEQLVAVTSWSNFLHSWSYTYTYREYEQLRDRTRSFSAMAAICPVDRSSVMIHGPGGGLDPGVPRRRQAPVDLVPDHRDPVFSPDLARAVGRAVVHDDDLKLHVFLVG